MNSLCDRVISGVSSFNAMLILLIFFFLIFVYTVDDPGFTLLAHVLSPALISRSISIHFTVLKMITETWYNLQQYNMAQILNS